MFRVDNLVFNKIGNSLSVMIFCNDKGVQILDETDFAFLSSVFSLKGLCVNKFLEFIFEILYEDKNYQSRLFLSDTVSFLQFEEKRYNVSIEDEKICIDVDEPNILFSLSMRNLKNIYVNNGKVEINEKNLFKGIVEFFIETNFT